MNQPKRILAVHDLCSFGRCSLTAAVPVLSAMGHQACPFPTAVFSNNFTFGSFVSTNLTEHMPGILDQWVRLGFRYDAVYSGFLADVEQMDIVEDSINRLLRERDGGLAVVDPAMGDDGKLYPIYTDAMVERMRRLASKADIITPNYTEACFLLDKPYDPNLPAADAVEAMSRELAALGSPNVVITSIPADGNRIKVSSYEAATNRFMEFETPRLPFATCGTGDIFTSVVTGSVLCGRSLETAVSDAMRFLSHIIQYTIDAGTDPREGVLVEPCLDELVRLRAVAN